MMCAFPWSLMNQTFGKKFWLVIHASIASHIFFSVASAATSNASLPPL